MNDFARDLFAFLIEKYNIVLESETYCGEIITGISDFYTDDIGRTIMVVAFTLRDFIHREVHLLDLFDSEEKLERYLMRFATIAARHFQPFKFLAICAIVSEMFAYRYYRCEKRFSIQSFFYAGTNCLTQIIDTTLSDILAHPDTWPNIVALVPGLLAYYDTYFCTFVDTHFPIYTSLTVNAPQASNLCYCKIAPLEEPIDRPYPAREGVRYVTLYQKIVVKGRNADENFGNKLPSDAASQSQHFEGTLRIFEPVEPPPEEVKKFNEEKMKTRVWYKPGDVPINSKFVSSKDFLESAKAFTGVGASKPNEEISSKHMSIGESLLDLKKRYSKAANKWNDVDERIRVLSEEISEEEETEAQSTSGCAQTVGQQQYDINNDCAKSLDTKSNDVTKMKKVRGSLMDNELPTSKEVSKKLEYDQNRSRSLGGFSDLYSQQSTGFESGGLRNQFQTSNSKTSKTESGSPKSVEAAECLPVEVKNHPSEGNISEIFRKDVRSAESGKDEESGSFHPVAVHQIPNLETELQALKDSNDTLNVIKPGINLEEKIACQIFEDASDKDLVTANTIQVSDSFLKQEPVASISNHSISPDSNTGEQLHPQQIGSTASTDFSKRKEQVVSGHANNGHFDEQTESSTPETSDCDEEYTVTMSETKVHYARYSKLLSELVLNAPNPVQRRCAAILAFAAALFYEPTGNTTQFHPSESESKVLQDMAEERKVPKVSGRELVQRDLRTYMQFKESEKRRKATQEDSSAILTNKRLSSESPNAAQTESVTLGSAKTSEFQETHSDTEENLQTQTAGFAAQHSGKEHVEPRLIDPFDQVREIFIQNMSQLSDNIQNICDTETSENIRNISETEKPETVQKVIIEFFKKGCYKRKK